MLDFLKPKTGILIIKKPVKTQPKEEKSNEKNTKSN